MVVVHHGDSGDRAGQAGGGRRGGRPSTMTSSDAPPPTEEQEEVEHGQVSTFAVVSGRARASSTAAPSRMTLAFAKPRVADTSRERCQQYRQGVNMFEEHVEAIERKAKQRRTANRYSPAAVYIKQKWITKRFTDEELEQERMNSTRKEVNTCNTTT